MFRRVGNEERSSRPGIGCREQQPGIKIGNCNFGNLSREYCLDKHRKKDAYLNLPQGIIKLKLYYILIIS